MNVANSQFSPAQIRVVNQILESDQSTAEQAEALILLVGRAGFESLLDHGVFPDPELRQLQAIAQILRYHDPLPTGPVAAIVPDNSGFPRHWWQVYVGCYWDDGVIRSFDGLHEHRTIWAPPVAWPHQST